MDRGAAQEIVKILCRLAVQREELLNLVRSRCSVKNCEKIIRCIKNRLCHLVHFNKEVFQSETSDGNCHRLLQVDFI